MKDAHHERKALLVVSDGGDNRSRYTEGEVRARCARPMWRFIPSASSMPMRQRPRNAPARNFSTMSAPQPADGSSMVDDVDEMSDIAEKISTELRNQYVIGYKPKDLSRDGKWRKVKVKVNPPPGLPPLTVYARTGYYAPLQ